MKKEFKEKLKGMTEKSKIIAITPGQTETTRFNPREEVKDPKLLKEWEEVVREINFL